MRDRTDLPAEADGPQRPDMRSTPHQASPSTRPAPHRPLREPPRWAPCSATQALTHCIIRAALQHNTIVCPRARAQRTALVRVGASGAHVPPNARTHTAWRACATSPVCGMAPPAAAAVAALRSGPPASLARTQPYVCLAAAGESSDPRHPPLPPRSNLRTPPFCPLSNQSSRRIRCEDTAGGGGGAALSPPPPPPPPKPPPPPGGF